MKKGKFLGWSNSHIPLRDADVVIFGVPLGKNSIKMVNFLRDASWFIESFDPNRERDFLENIKISDIGNISLTSLDDISRQTKKIIDLNKIPLILGKSHLLTLYALMAFDDVKLVSFDAHADIKDYYMDKRVACSVEPLSLQEPARYNCATWLRRFCELGNERKVCLVGMRSCGEDDYNYLKENRILHFTPNDIRKDLPYVKGQLASFCQNSKIYISVDIDFFDPSIAPSVEHPEHNGLSFQEFSELVKELYEERIVGFDLVEIQYLPEKIREITESLAVRIIMEILSGIKPNKPQ
jgi:agmatinase